MWSNPFRSEAGAFRLVLLTLVASAAVGVAALSGGATAAVPVWAAVSLAAVVILGFGRRPTRVLRTAPAHAGPADERRMIVLAQTSSPPESLGELGRYADRVFVVSAATASPVRRWVSDTDDAREQAGRRVAETVRSLRSAHVDAVGAIGDGDPVRALEDTLREFGGDEIVVATGPSARDAAVATRVRRRFALPVTHVVE